MRHRCASRWRMRRRVVGQFAGSVARRVEPCQPVGMRAPSAHEKAAQRGAERLCGCVCGCGCGLVPVADEAEDHPDCHGAENRRGEGVPAFPRADHAEPVAET